MHQTWPHLTQVSGDVILVVVIVLVLQEMVVDQVVFGGGHPAKRARHNHLGHQGIHPFRLTVNVHHFGTALVLCGNLFNFIVETFETGGVEAGQELGPPVFR